MMKKLLLIMMFLSVLQLVQAQDTLVKWTFPTGLAADAIQNGTNALNLSRTILVDGTAAITWTNGQILGDFAATATGWDNGMDLKNWNIDFITTGYDNIKISSKQRAGGNNGGPKDFKLQYKTGSTGTWADVNGGSITLGNEWTTGVISNLALPIECQNQPNLIYIRWIMASNTDIKGGNVASGGISKIDDIVVTGMPLTGLADQKTNKYLDTFPNPSTSFFSITMEQKTSLLEIYNSNGQLVYKTIPENEILTVETPLPAGLYFIKATQSGRMNITKHIVR
jgi:hypothetical protein